MTARCGWCGTGLTIVLDLGNQPLANAYVSAGDLAESERRFPLDLAVCEACGLVQITKAVPPEEMFREYAYFSSTSDAFVEHARKIVLRMRNALGLSGTSLAIEVASNDGYLLQHYVTAGIPVLGIDPARNVAAEANARGVETLPEFFDAGVAAELVRTGRTADVLHANNVIAHVPDLDAFVGAIARVLKPAGVAVIETPYVRDLVERLEFDTVYHEHRYYHSLTTLTRIFDRHGLEIVGVERIPVHGGSLRVFAGHRGLAGVASVDPDSVRTMLDEEALLGVATAAWYLDFAGRVGALGDTLRTMLGDLKADGRSIAAYGAAAKGTVLLNAFGIGLETLDFVADRSTHKQGLMMPGVHVPIVPAERLVADRPDVCLLLAWNFADEILAQQSEYREAGGRFLVPVPTPRLV